MKRHHALVLGLLVCVFGCEGDAGPTGPTGPQGQQGTQGIQGVTGESFQYFIGSAPIGSDETAVLWLPVGAGTETNPPLVTCYIGDGSGAWLVVGTDLSYGGPTCGMVWSQAQTRWYAAVLGGIYGWTFRVVAVW